MIAPLRARHRAVFVVLGVLLPLLFLLALMARRARPVVDPLPAELVVGGQTAPPAAAGASGE